MLMAYGQTLPNTNPATQGGLLYDKYWKAMSRDEPSGDQPLWATQTTNERSGADTWRCKECHGWDYLGKDGAYATGKHSTGTVGVLQAKAMSATGLAILLRGQQHGYTADMLSDKDLIDLANFLNKGMLDMNNYINRESKKVAGDINKGAASYQTICAGCHDLDGKGEDEAPPLGKLSNKNPWETAHKILNGQPDAEMPALRALDLQVTMDILAYLQTLPKD